jgi:elongation factor G
MSDSGGVRCAAIVGPYTSGKTTLLEALLYASGAIHRKGRVPEGNTVGDSSPEARARQMSVEPNVAGCEYLGDQWRFIDCPGSVELTQDTYNALMAADVAIVVAEPEADRAVTLAPLFKFLDDYQIPHMLFVNKTDRLQGRVRDLLAALQTVSSRPLVLRQVPIRDGDGVVGAVDLVSERAWQYQENKPSSLVELPEKLKDREEEARQEMLEALADFDDGLLEELLEDKTPATDDVYAQLTKDLQEDLIVPVFLGSAEYGNGITRLLKALRHEAPGVAATAERRGIAAKDDFVASVIKTLHLPHTGKLSIARIWHGKVKDNASIGGNRLSGLLSLQGGHQEKLSQAEAGDLIAFARMDDFATGDIITSAGRDTEAEVIWPEALPAVYALAVTPLNRQDEVKLSASIAKLIEEDPSLAIEHNQDTHEMVLWGQGEIHLLIAAERLKNKFNVEVKTQRPHPAYKETIRKGIDQHARHKRQTGGHGQFADIKVKISPQPRGTGFHFENEIVGGAVPRQYIPAVEHGVSEFMQRGPLGFPVVDVAVTLYDGQFHAVDSSDMAFKTAGRLAMNEGLPKCDPVLLEPICEVSIFVPSDFTNKVHGLISGRRGQILGFDARAGWNGWDEVKAHMPQAELPDLIIDLRSLTLGIGTYTWDFHHLQELHGRTADKVVEERKAELEQ